MTEFQPRMLSGNRPCCTASYALCDACKEHHAVSESAYIEHQREHLGAAAASPDEIAFFTPELRRRDAGFAQITDVGETSGTYQTVDGKTKKFTFDKNGAILTPAFAKAQNAVLAAYAPALAALRTANAPDPSSFEERYKAERSREFGLDKQTVEPTLTACTSPEDMARFRAPDSYQIALDKRRSNR
jgi:hypothetical protein